MATLAEALRGMISAEELSDLTTALDREAVSVGVEAVTTPGACSPLVGASKLTTDGTDAVTLADGSVVGQRKSITMIVGTTTPVANITPANYADGTTVALSAAGESVVLEWDGSTWHTVGGSGYAIS